MSLSKKNLALIVFLVLTILTLSTDYYGSTDIGDYSDVAKFFSGKYRADIRSSHSYLYGFVHSIFLFGNSFFMLKISSLIFLGLIIYSVYQISKKNRKALWMMLLSPIVWYMAPWINPIQIASLFLLWSWHFLEKYNKGRVLKDLIYSGTLLGFGWAFWDTILFFGVLLTLVYFFNKRFSHLLLFLLFILVGLTPRLILDSFLFNFPFYSILKSSLGNISFLLGGVYGDSSHTSKGISNIVSILLAIPIYFWTLYKKKHLLENKKSMIFLSLGVLLIFFNPQPRYALALAPIMVVLLGREIKEFQFRRHVLASVLIILFLTAPYTIQIFKGIDGEVYGADSLYIMKKGFDFSLEENPSQEILADLDLILEKYPGSIFIVGPHADHYQLLADLYWGDNVKEFVSIQDYDLWSKEESTLFEKEFRPIPNINNRRQIWLAGGLDRNINDNTDYKNIKHAISIIEPLDLGGFSLEEKYNKLYLYTRS